MPSFPEILQNKRVLVCVGSGGVGKTTTAATVALEGARRGAKTLVLTIDPAKRLANSLGLEKLDHEERRVPDDVIAPVKPGGALYAMMLDQKRAFDEVVERYAKDPASVKSILANPIYAQISSSLSGSHEYAAMAKLYQIARERDYQLIVVDTPPTAHALDFLDAPEKVANAIDSPAVEWFVKPVKSTGRFSLRMIGAGGSFILKRIAKFVGSAFLEDMARFFVEFNDVLGGFRQRAREVFDLLRGPEVGFIGVAAPEPSVVDEVLFFHQRLVQSSMPFAGFVVNRVHPRCPPPPEKIHELLAADPRLSELTPYDLSRTTEALLETYRELSALAEADALQVARLRAIAGGAPVAEIPFLETDVHDVNTLGKLAAHLFRTP